MRSVDKSTERTEMKIDFAGFSPCRNSDDLSVGHLPVLVVMASTCVPCLEGGGEGEFGIPGVVAVCSVMMGVR